PGTRPPTGTVAYKDGATTLATGTLDGAGQATFTTSSLSAAAHSMTAVYNGDGNFITSTSSVVTQTVNPGPFAKLQILVPGETAAPGTALGKTGTPTAQTAGAAFTVTVNPEDADSNLVNTLTDTGAITSSDTNAGLPGRAALVAGTKTFSLTF